MTSNPLFVVDREAVDGNLILRAAGEIDGDTIRLLDDAAAKAIESASALVVVDLTDVTFIGSTGLNELLAVTEECRARELTLVIAAPPGSVARRIVEISGLWDHLAVADSVSEAISRRR
ncbi:anti-anti-sigma factor [Lentzea albidocapillata subsp. violacea]|uniref:Anti-sigma factor antagonist n=1 Tax=Lentzea albidocapillata subsp. violacea TaxID=128104 RepID=A0A1G8YP05_9PSEU|nr:anti-anti-sigma factor [Lentzea albidocapillata subsp. violacea]